MSMVKNLIETFASNIQTWPKLKFLSYKTASQADNYWPDGWTWLTTQIHVTHMDKTKTKQQTQKKQNSIETIIKLDLKYTVFECIHTKATIFGIIADVSLPF